MNVEQESKEPVQITLLEDNAKIVKQAKWMYVARIQHHGYPWL